MNGIVPAILPLHILGGVVGIVSGFLALFVLKGSRLHRKSGRIFVYAMLVMSGLGIMMAMVKLNIGNVMGGGLTFYLVATSMLTVRPRASRAVWMDRAALLLALALALAGLTFGFMASGSVNGKFAGSPPAMYFVFATIALLSAAGDIRMMRTRGLQGRPRIARHLWRMCFALFIAAASFSLVPSRIPAPLRIPALLPVPVLMPLVAMAYWLWRIRVKATLSTLLARTRYETLVINPKEQPS